jgi:tetratricopeptide (TPR) repeat protein
MPGQPMISPINGTLDDIPMLRDASITPIGTPMGPSSGESNAKTPKEMVELHCQRAFEHMRQGAYEDSIREYKRALEYNPDYLPALNNLAIVFEKKPSWHQQAIEQWERVHQLSKMKGDQKHIDRAQKHLASLRKMQ